ncbi:MAG: HD domain-containing protein [Lachnospiraceae bacterium]|jgi:(p)ppGpp synthase/HD superfamily hydrolase
MTEMSMVEKARKFAYQAHDGQKRKGKDTPYIVHPCEVAEILEQAGCRPEVICAGWLHDTVEDTGTTLDVIAREFGNFVAELVAWCTEDKRGTWEERKKHTICLLESQEIPRDAMMVICADKLSNLRSLSRDYQVVGEKLWERFRRPKEYQGWYYGAIQERMGSLRDTFIYQEYKDLYQQVFQYQEAVCK